MEKSIWSKDRATYRRLLKEQRLECQLTQAELASRLNTPQSYVSKIENGERKLDVVELLTVLKALEVDPHRFLDKVLAETS